ncbi:MAG: 50S ribosomal protein L9 [Spirochaetales bacterium]|nr:50S ribosomal protein L9 [Spirochaetales bacterium]
MKIILNNDVVHLGEEGDVVTVKDGYARNYLLPTGAAVIYNKANAAMFKQRAEQIAKRKAEKRAASASLKERLDNVSISLVVTAGESGKLFGSITSQMVQEALLKEGFEIEKKKLDVPTHAIKMTGTYHIVAHLYENDKANITLNVLSEAEVKAAAKKAAEEAKKAAEAEAKAKAEAEAKAAEEAAPAEETAEAEAPVEG